MTIIKHCFTQCDHGNVLDCSQCEKAASDALLTDTGTGQEEASSIYQIDEEPAWS